ncbi:Atrial natriuretic peptide receptor 1 [Hypsibius exemplaris]|uniref:guanylate cyclase n=1 Tax=Hypsibius exemplaris TaxID=2072580 RepID=A0A1W0WB56_HYPEX|nr:Atrial natriuretic peptide receptor 1 [Hypsibius exemplaris]
MCVMMERNMKGAVYDYNKMGAAFDLALSYAKESVLPAWLNIRKVYRNIGNVCSYKTGIVAHAMYLWQEKGVNCDIYMGPGCGQSAETLNTVAEYLNIPIFGCPSAGLGQSAPSSDYVLFTRISYGYSAITEVLVRFFAYQNYTTPIIFQDNSISFYTQMSTIVQTTLQHKRANSQLTRRIKFVPFVSKTFVDDSVIRELLINASVTSRVFVILADGNTVRNFMITASKLGFTTGDYVFMAIELYQSLVWGSFSYRRDDANDEIAREAFKTLLLLSLDSGVGSDQAIFWDRFTLLAQTEYNFSANANLSKIVDPVVLHAFDAVLLYSTLVTEMAANNESYRNGYDISTKASGHSFISPVTGTVKIDDNGDRALSYLVRSFDYRAGKHYGIIGVPPLSKEMIVFGDIDWPGTNNTGLPPNTPRCGFRGENPICKVPVRRMTKSETSSAVIVPLILAVLIIYGGYNGLQKYLLSGKDPFWWRILKQELIIHVGKNQGSVKSLQSGISSKNGKPTPETEYTEAQGARLTATYGGALVSIHPLPQPYKRVPSALPKEAARIRNLLHPNLQKFVGIAVNENNVCEFLVGEVCRKGSLRTLLETENLDLDLDFQYSLMKNIVSGMTFLHSSPIASHGYLNDWNCHVDNQFILKISSYGLESLRNEQDLRAVAPVSEDRDYGILLWRAPELLRTNMPVAGTQKGDVYSFAILLQQIILRSEPFEKFGRHHQAEQHKSGIDDGMSSEEIILDVRHGLVPPLRPPVPVSACTSKLYELMESCWDENPTLRPTFTKIRSTLKSITGKVGNNVIDHMIQRIELDLDRLFERSRVDVV